MIKKPKRPDCNSCYHFSKCDFNETEGYCRICKKHLNPKEGEECEQFEPYSLYCDTDSAEPLFDTRVIKPERYAELREQDFDTWLDTILHEIIEQVNFNASEVDTLGGAVWNGECPDGTPYPKQCAREDAYIQCIRQSNQLDILKRTVSDLESQITSLETQLTELKAFIGYTLSDPTVKIHIGSDFCGNCKHCTPPKTSANFHLCALSGEIVDPDESSCAMWETPVSNQLDKELSGKPDREECKSCPKPQCDNCLNYPF